MATSPSSLVLLAATALTACLPPALLTWRAWHSKSQEARDFALQYTLSACALAACLLEPPDGPYNSAFLALLPFAYVAYLLYLLFPLRADFAVSFFAPGAGFLVVALLRLLPAGEAPWLADGIAVLLAGVCVSLLSPRLPRPHWAAAAVTLSYACLPLLLLFLPAASVAPWRMLLVQVSTAATVWVAPRERQFAHAPLVDVRRAATDELSVSFTPTPEEARETDDEPDAPAPLDPLSV